MSARSESSVNKSRRDATLPMARLSEKNLRMHNATCHKKTTYLQKNIDEDTNRNMEYKSYRQLFDEAADWEDTDSDMHDGEIAIRRAASLDALKVYAGAFTSLQADSCVRMEKDMLDESGTWFCDMDQLDLGQLASDMVHVQVTLDDTKGSSIGSPSPSSDTLSVSRYEEVKSTRKEGTKNRKRTGVVRRR
ncbi:hypothetical protein K504DRAFT_492330 [Pleomassaria siparia CBS 279.74]|uniref:Uncharacterized protein n=1 Tax=Pleomassaria siparia CBS 279.74 TaxID=1314801 RepID=A0A6G1K4E4_9PLEO|nr:hypothetical protein K504DRAFT_492330 [Pleomassaria siparia CBS 279.74]